MNEEMKKDALTDLVDIGSQPTNSSSNNGSVSTPTGEKVELEFNDKLRELARKLIGHFIQQKQQEKEVLEQMVAKNLKEKHKRSKTN